VLVGIPALDVEENEVDVAQFFIADAVSQSPVGIEGRVDAHCLYFREELYGKSILHQGFTTAEREPTCHDF
jgi:hypothetical protein